MNLPAGQAVHDVEPAAICPVWLPAGHVWHPLPSNHEVAPVQISQSADEELGSSENPALQSVDVQIFQAEHV